MSRLPQNRRSRDPCVSVINKELGTLRGGGDANSGVRNEVSSALRAEASGGTSWRWNSVFGKSNFAIFPGKDLWCSLVLVLEGFGGIFFIPKMGWDFSVM